jgi:hypothetical protein
MCSLAAAAAVTVPLLAQQAGVSRSGRPGGQPGAVPRHVSGHPDLQGVWTFSTVTPLQRPAELAEKARFASQEEADAYAKRAALNLDRPPRAGDPGAYNQFWIDAGTSVTKSLRTSLIVDPPDGRIPPLTPEGQKRLTATNQAVALSAGPEDRSLYERCILGFNAGPPVIPGPYNNMLEIFQTSDHLVLLTEMVHDARVIPMLKAAAPMGVPQWKGNSIGRWEGDTFVIESRNFRDGTGTISFRPATDRHLKLTERLRRVDAETLEYQFTIDDPTVWTKPWTGIVEMTRSDDRLYEFACHEGNHAMVGMLRGARATEQSSQSAR